MVLVHSRRPLTLKNVITTLRLPTLGLFCKISTGILQNILKKLMQSKSISSPLIMLVLGPVSCCFLLHLMDEFWNIKGPMIYFASGILAPVGRGFPHTHLNISCVGRVSSIISRPFLFHIFLQAYDVVQAHAPILRLLVSRSLCCRSQCV